MLTLRWFPAFCSAEQFHSNRVVEWISIRDALARYTQPLHILRAQVGLMTIIYIESTFFTSAARRCHTFVLTVARTCSVGNAAATVHSLEQRIFTQIQLTESKLWTTCRTEHKHIVTWFECDPKEHEFNSNAHWILSWKSAVELDTTIDGTTISAPIEPLSDTNFYHLFS